VTIRALVQNAANVDQVKRAGRKDRDADAERLAAIVEVLRTVAGRRVFADLLERAGLYESSFDQSQSLLYFKEGRRNFGLEMRAALERADEELTDLMDRERRTRRKLDDRAIDALHTPSAVTADTPETSP
jgi:hypothetical protein